MTREVAITNANRDELVEQYRDYVAYVVNHLIKRLGFPAEMFEEFAAAGYLGLVEAAGRFDPECGRDFRAFAFLRIRGAIIDSIRASSDLSGKAYRYARALSSAQNLREEMWERETRGDGDAAKDLEAVFDFAAKSLLAFRLSVADNEEEVSELVNPEIDAEEQYKTREQAHLLRNLVATLPDKERLIVEEHYFQDKAFVQITADHPTLSKSWVSRLHSRALDLLKERYYELRAAGGDGVELSDFI